MLIILRTQAKKENYNTPMDKETIRGGKVREDLLHKIIALQILRME